MEKEQEKALYSDLKTTEINFFTTPKKMLKSEEIKALSGNGYKLLSYLLSLHNSFHYKPFYQSAEKLSDSMGFTKRQLHKAKKDLLVINKDFITRKGNDFWYDMVCFCNSLNA